VSKVNVEQKLVIVADKSSATTVVTTTATTATQTQVNVLTNENVLAV